MKKMTQLAAAVAIASGAVMATPAVAGELGASAAVASAYLWRGYDLGDGSPAVSGDLVYSEGGAYGGIWISSGDDALGTEVDFFAGYGADLGGVTVDLSVWNYVYPDSPDVDGDNIGFAELSEVILTVGAGPISVSYYDNVAGGSGYEYYTVSGEVDKFSATLGMHDNEDGKDPLHLTVSYAFNDNISFTASQWLQDEDGDTTFVVSYSLPVEL